MGKVLLALIQGTISTNPPRTRSRNLSRSGVLRGQHWARSQGHATPRRASKQSFIGTWPCQAIYVVSEAAFLRVQGQSCGVVTDTIWPRKRKIFTLRLFTEQV